MDTPNQADEPSNLKINSQPNDENLENDSLLNPNQEKEDNYLIILKYSFASDEANAYGVAYVLLNSKTHGAQYQQVATSPYSSILTNTYLEDSWSNFINYVKNEAQKSSTQQQQLEKKILIASKSGFETSEILEIKNLILKGKKEKITELVKSILLSILFDRNIVIKLHLETVKESDVDEYFNKEENKKEEEEPTENQKKNKISTTSIKPHKDFSNLPQNSTLLECYPVLAPITGKPIFDIKVGDEIMVKIFNDAKGQKYNAMLKLKGKEGNTLSILATVIEIKIQDQAYLLLVQIKDSLYGKISESEQVKLKMNSEKSEEKKNTKEENDLGKMILYFSIFIGIVILFLMII